MPLEAWAIVVVPLASVFVVLFAIPTVFVPLYFVPFTVTDQLFDVDESIRPELPDTSCNFQLTVDVLFVIDCPVTSQLNFNVSHDVTVTLLLPLVAIMNHPRCTHNSNFPVRPLLQDTRTYLFFW